MSSFDAGNERPGRFSLRAKSFSLPIKIDSEENSSSVVIDDDEFFDFCTPPDSPQRGAGDSFSSVDSPTRRTRRTLKSVSESESHQLVSGDHLNSRHSSSLRKCISISADIRSSKETREGVKGLSPGLFASAGSSSSVISTPMVSLREAVMTLESQLRQRTVDLGPRHPKTLSCQLSLAKILLRTGQEAKAQELFEDAAEGLGASLGSTHPRTVAATAQLADFYDHKSVRVAARHASLVFAAEKKGNSANGGDGGTEGADFANPPHESRDNPDVEEEVAVEAAALEEEVALEARRCAERARSLFEEVVTARRAMGEGSSLDAQRAVMQLADLLVRQLPPHLPPHQRLGDGGAGSGGSSGNKKGSDGDLSSGPSEQKQGEEEEEEGSVVEREGRAVERAQRLYESALEVLQAELGATHPHALACEYNLAVLLQQHAYDEDEDDINDGAESTDESSSYGSSSSSSDESQTSSGRGRSSCGTEESVEEDEKGGEEGGDSEPLPGKKSAAPTEEEEEEEEEGGERGAQGTTRRRQQQQKPSSSLQSPHRDRPSTRRPSIGKRSQHRGRRLQRRPQGGGGGSSGGGLVASQAVKLLRAQRHYEAVVSGRTSELGPTHPDTLRALSSLVDLLVEMRGVRGCPNQDLLAIAAAQRLARAHRATSSSLGDSGGGGGGGWGGNGGPVRAPPHANTSSSSSSSSSSSTAATATTTLSPQALVATLTLGKLLAAASLDQEPEGGEGEDEAAAVVPSRRGPNGYSSGGGGSTTTTTTSRASSSSAALAAKEEVEAKLGRVKKARAVFEVVVLGMSETWGAAHGATLSRKLEVAEALMDMVSNRVLSLQLEVEVQVEETAPEGSAGRRSTSGDSGGHEDSGGTDHGNHSREDRGSGGGACGGADADGGNGGNGVVASASDEERENFSGGSGSGGFLGERKRSVYFSAESLEDSGSGGEATLDRFLNANDGKGGSGQAEAQAEAAARAALKGLVEELEEAKVGMSVDAVVLTREAVKGLASSLGKGHLDTLNAQLALAKALLLLKRRPTPLPPYSVSPWSLSSSSSSFDSGPSTAPPSTTTTQSAFHPEPAAPPPPQAQPDAQQQKGLPPHPKSSPPPNPAAGSSREAELAERQHRERQQEAARRVLEVSVRTYERVAGAHHPQTKAARSLLGTLLRSMAQEAAERARCLFLAASDYDIGLVEFGV